MLILKSKRNDHIADAVRDIISGQPDEYYDTYKIGYKSLDYDHRIINWLYTVRCETEYSGKKLCDHYLWTLKDTIGQKDWKADHPDFEICKLLIYILILKIRPNL